MAGIFQFTVLDALGFNDCTFSKSIDECRSFDLLEHTELDCSSFVVGEFLADCGIVFEACLVRNWLLLTLSLVEDWSERTGQIRPASVTLKNSLDF